MNTSSPLVFGRNGTSRTTSSSRPLQTLSINMKDCLVHKKGELISGFLEKQRKQRAEQFLNINPSTYPSKAQLLLNFTPQEVQSRVLSSSSQVNQGVQYYFKNIHEHNRRQIMSQQGNRQKKFILFENKQKTFDQKFQGYLTQLLKTDSKPPKPSSFELFNTVAELKKHDLGAKFKFKTLDSNVELKHSQAEIETNQGKVTFLKQREKPKALTSSQNLLINPLDQELRQMKKKSKETWREYCLIVDQIKELITPQFFALICKEKHAQRQNTCSKKLFNEFLTSRYGSVYAEKWQYLLDFTSGGALSFEKYCDQMMQIFKNKEVLLQMGFDFFDTNNDDQISQIDLFKIFFVFGGADNQSSIFKDAIHSDLVALITLQRWKLAQNILANKIVPTTDFRQLMFLDADFVQRKQRILKPIFDFRTRGPLNMETNPASWVEDLIREDVAKEFVSSNKKFKFEDINSPRFELDSERRELSSRKPIRKNEEKNLPTHVYMANRPGAKLAQLTKSQREKSKLLQDTTLKLVDQFVNDQHFTNYFEHTLSSQNVHLDLAQFKNISFSGGMPLIVVDLLCYLTGGHHGNEEVSAAITCAIKMLKERVAPKKKNKKGLKYDKAARHPRKTTTLTSLLIRPSAVSFATIVPPLKNYPEEIETDYSSDSDTSQHGERATIEKDKRDATIVSQVLAISPKPVSKQVRDKMEQLFKTLSEVNPKRLAKIAKVNEIHKKSSHGEQFEEKKPELADYSMSETSLVAGCAKAFDASCDIFARILYIKASGLKDYCRIGFNQFYSVLLPLLNENLEKKNLAVFTLLDLDCDGVLDLLSMMNIYKHLPEKCLLKYEFFLLLREYKERNVLMKKGYQGQIQMDFENYNNVIPNSALGQYLVHQAFGFHFPYQYDQPSPQNPFEVIASDAEWAKLKKKMYPKFGFLQEEVEQEEAAMLLNKIEIQKIYDCVKFEPSYLTSKLK